MMAPPTSSNDSGKKRDPRNGLISQSDEEGVEVVLNERGSDKVVEAPSHGRPTPDQNVFRGPHAVRPRPGRSHHSSGPPPHLQGSGSFSYPPAVPSGEYPPPPRAYPVPPYNPSGSFDDGSSYHRQSHHSPHVQYPHAGSSRYASEDVNVISPNHKGDPKYGPPMTPRSRHAHPPPHPHPHAPPSHPYSHPHAPPPNSHHYQYPPTSPVIHPGAHSNSPPRLRNFPLRRGDGPYSKAQRGEQHPDDGTWNPYPGSARTGSVEQRGNPQLVTESSFDSDHYSGSHYSHPSHPPTPGSHIPPPHHDPHHHYYSGAGPGPAAGSWGGSFDSSAPPPAHYDDYRHGYHHHPPESPYSPHSPHSPHSPYSPPYPPQYQSQSGYYSEPYSPYHHGYGPPPHSYDDDERGLLKDYHPDRDGEEANAVTPHDPKKRHGAGNDKSGMVLPKAAQEIDFEVTDPPMEPVLPPGEEPICDSLADVNSFDVLCGRGGGTNSQIGNKRFRKLVQEFQPTYLLARRKEKPLLARTIVLIIRKRGGHFLRKDEDTGMMYEVGDSKAEAKTSQALREGLDVRATKSAANSLVDKKKKKKKGKGDKPEDSSPSTADPTDTPGSKKSTSTCDANDDAPETPPGKSDTTKIKLEDSPPTLPRLQDEEVKAGMVHPHSPEAAQYRKRRRMRTNGCTADKFFPDFCPPRADLGRTGSPIPGEEMDMSHAPHRRHGYDGPPIMPPPHAHAYGHMPRGPCGPPGCGPIPHPYETEHIPTPGCADIAMAIMTGDPSGGLCSYRGRGDIKQE